MNIKPKFLKPGENTWEEDKADLDTNSATQFVYNAHRSLAIDIQRQRLPIFKNRNHIIYLLENYQTLVLVGETGCGKSTQVPQVLWVTFFTDVWKSESRKRRQERKKEFQSSVRMSLEESDKVRYFFKLGLTSIT